jgi:hypothetical protein
VRVDRKYVVAVALLAVLAVGFGLAGTFAPVSEKVSPRQSSSSSSDSVTHFVNPPTFDSGWVNITTKPGQYIPIMHGLNTTEVVVDIAGKRSLDPDGGALAWSRTFGGADYDRAYSVVQTSDGGYAIAGSTWSYGAGYADFWLVKTDGEGEAGLVCTGLTNYAIILYRGNADPYWNYVRVRIWTIQEPTWQYGDINQDGVVDIQDLYILAQNYGKTFSALSLIGIIAIAGIHQHKKRKQPKQK